VWNRQRDQHEGDDQRSRDSKNPVVNVKFEGADGSFDVALADLVIRVDQVRVAFGKRHTGDIVNLRLSIGHGAFPASRRPVLRKDRRQ
jgi:hypothetical protein